MVFSSDNLKPQVFTFENDSNKPQIVLLCKSNRILPKDLVERVAKKVAENLQNGDNKQQIQCKLVEKEEGKFDISYEGKHEIVEIKDHASPIASKVKEVSLKNLESKAKTEKKLSRFFNRIIEIASSPFTWVHNSISSEQRAITKEVKNAAQLLGKVNQKSICAQLSFVNKTLDNQSPELNEALKNGQDIQKAASKAANNENKTKNPIKQLAAGYIAKVNSGQTVILPFAVQNAHILIIKKNEDGSIILEDRCLAQADRKIPIKTVYKFPTSEEAEQFLNDLISELKPPTKVPYEFILNIFTPKEKLEQLKQDSVKDPVNTLLKSNKAEKIDSQPSPEADLVSSSTDPLKMIYEFVSDLKPDGKVSKAQFYREYAQYLINLYNNQSDRLKTKEKIELLEGLSQIVDNQLFNSLKKELGPVAADQVISNIKTWIADKRKDLKTSSKAEDSRLAALKSEAKPAVIGLTNSIDQVTGEQQGLENLQAHIDPALLREIKRLENPAVKVDEALHIIRKMDGEVGNLLATGKLTEARLLSMSLMRAIPPLDHELWVRFSYADFQKRDECIQRLSDISFHFSESVALSGATMHPFEAFEIQINIPILIRTLIDKQCEEAMRDYQANGRGNLKGFDETKAGYVVLYSIGGGAAELKNDLLLGDSSLMIGADPKMQARYNAAKEKFTSLSARKQSAGLSGTSQFENLAREKNPNITTQELSTIQAQFAGLKSNEQTVIPKPWSALAAAEALGWIVTAPGECLQRYEGPEENRNLFVREMARAKRIELAKIDSGSTLSLVDKEAGVDIPVKTNLNSEQLQRAVKEAAEGRKQYLGGLQPRMIGAQVNDQNNKSGMSEPSALREAYDKAGSKDPKLIFKMLEAGAATTDSQGNQQFSHFSVINCFEVILQFPYLLDDPAVQDRLLQVLSDRNVLSTFLEKNPQFIVRISPIIEKMIAQKLEIADGKPKDIAGALFLMDLSHRIYDHANHAKINEITSTLKPYGVDNGISKTVALFEQAKDPIDRIKIAGYIVRFYSNEAPPTLDAQSWKHLLVAKAVAQGSPNEAGHPVAVTLALQKLQESHLPFLTSNNAKTNEVLGLLVDKPNSKWYQIEGHYRYELSDSPPPFILDIQTGQGFTPASSSSERMFLPPSLTNSPLIRKVMPGLNGKTDISAVKRTVGADTIYEFQFNNTQFKLIQTSGEDKLKLIQVRHGQEYAFTEANLNEHDKSSITNLIRENGLWINTKNPNDVQVPAKGIILDEQSYHASIKENEITEISVGTGNQKRIVCSDDKVNSYTQIINCRPTEGMIFLKSPSSQGVDEIRFPEGLEMINRDGIWKIKGNESFEWQIDNTGDLESRFGKEFSQTMMAFTNPVTNEQIIWIWPQKATSTGKRGADLKFGAPENATPILLTKSGQKETTSAAGFLYLSYLAYSHGNYALAVEYLKKGEGVGGKPLTLPSDKDQIDAFKRVADLLLKTPSATTAQKAFQLKLRLTLLQTNEKLPLSEQGFVKEKITLEDVSEMKKQYETLALSQIQTLKNEGLSLSASELKAYAVLNEAPTQEQKLRKIEQASKKRVETKEIPKIKVDSTPAPTWQNHFTEVARETLQRKYDEAVRFFPVDGDMPPVERAKNEAIRKGIEDAILEKADLSKDGQTLKGFLELDPKKIGSLREQVLQISKSLQTEVDKEQKNILGCGRHYAEELGLSSLIAGKLLDDAKLMSIMLDKYQDGELNVLPDEIRIQLEEQITRYLIASTELQQLNKAGNIFVHLENMHNSNPSVIKSLDWSLQSKELFRFLTEGSNHSRHCDAEGNIDFKGRRYLVTEFRSENVTRQKAKDAIESMLDSPQKFVKVRMGLGKSTFIFPHLARFLMDKGQMPVVMFTEELLEQSRGFMDPKAYIFQFDRKYGIDDNEKERLKAQLKLTDDQIEIQHLTSLYDALASLRGDGRYPITTPQRRAALHNKKFELLHMKKMAIQKGDFAQANVIQEKLELIKKIDGVFKQPGVRELHDEDVNLNISRDYDYAMDTAVKMDPINVEAANYLMQTILNSDNPVIEILLKKPILEKSLSSKSKEHFSEAMDSLAKEVLKTFEATSQPKPDAEWLEKLKGVDQRELVAYMIGKRNTPPVGFPPFTDSTECKRFAAIRTYLSETLPNLYKSQDNLDRGLAAENGCVVVPYQNEKEQVGNRYANTKEALMHAFLYYATNSCTEEVFDNQLKEIKWSEKPEWKEFSKKLEALRLEKGLKTPYQAFILPEAADLRLQLLNRMINEGSQFNINKAKINCNSQDIVKGNEVNVASGTGDAFSLNLAEGGQEVQSAIIEGETYLKMDLNARAMKFNDPMEFIKSMVGNNDCHGIMIQGYSIGNDTKSIIADLRKEAPHRQFIYPDASNNNVLMMWLPGAEKPEPYVRSRIDLDLAINIYTALGTRGIDLPMKRGNEVFTVNMIGPGSKEEDVNQSAWRPRFLGSGQKQIVAYQANMEQRIRNNNDLGNAEEILAGHVINDIKKESLTDVGNSRVKAVVYRARSHIKQFAEEELSKPLSAKESQLVNGQLPLGSKVENALFEVYESLYIVGIDEDWEQQYGEKKELNPTLFYGKMQQRELNRVRSFDKECLFKMADLLTEDSGKVHLKTLHSLDLSKPITNEWIAKNYQLNVPDDMRESVIANIAKELNKQRDLLLFLEKVGKLDPPVTLDDFKGVTEATILEYLKPENQEAFIGAMNQFNGAMQANQKAKNILSEDWGKVKDPAFVSVLNQNLPARIAAEANPNQNAQVQVQQQQKQQVQAQQQQENQVNVQRMGSPPAAPYQPPAALSLNSFISGNKNNYVSDLGILSGVISTHNKSVRAKALLDQNIANPGAPIVYRLVLQDANGKMLRTCLITASDYSESIGKELELLRQQQHGIRVGVYPLTKGQPPLPAYDATNDVPVENDEFVMASAWDKLLIGWTEFTDAERKYLEFALPNLDDMKFSEFKSFDEEQLKATEKAVMMKYVKDRFDNFGKLASSLYVSSTSRTPTMEQEEVLREARVEFDENIGSHAELIKNIMLLPPAEKKEALASFIASTRNYAQRLAEGKYEKAEAIHRPQLGNNPALKNAEQAKQLQAFLSKKSCIQSANEVYVKHLLEFLTDLENGTSRQEIFNKYRLKRSELGI